MATSPSEFWPVGMHSEASQLGFVGLHKCAQGREFPSTVCQACLSLVAEACVQAKNSTCPAQTSGSLMLQARQSTMKSQSQRAAADGFMTMWSDSTTTIVGGSCEYANAANGGLGSPAASSPYIASEGYCAVDSMLYSSGAACGSCWRVSYDGSPATDPGVPGSMVVQVVDSGSARTFDCHLTAFQRITGASTGVFPITYEPVDCDVGSAGPVATVLDGDNAWYTKVIFSNLVSGVLKADLFLGESAFTMSRVSGGTWSASTAGKRDAASFAVTLDTGDIIAFRCFDSWPVPTGSSCTGPSASTAQTTQSTTTTTTENPSTTTGTEDSTTTTTLTETSLPASKVWSPVDGGEGRACRGGFPGDNSPATKPLRWPKPWRLVRGLVSSGRSASEWSFQEAAARSGPAATGFLLRNLT